MYSKYRLRLMWIVVRHTHVSPSWCCPEYRPNRSSCSTGTTMERGFAANAYAARKDKSYNAIITADVTANNLDLHFWLLSQARCCRCR